MTDDEIITVVQAHIDGKPIEICSKGQGKDEKWYDVVNPKWDFQNCDYRVKPDYEWATHKFETYIGGKLQTHELRLPLNVTDDIVRQVCDGLKTLVYRFYSTDTSNPSKPTTNVAEPFQKDQPRKPREWTVVEMNEVLE